MDAVVERLEKFSKVPAEADAGRVAGTQSVTGAPVVPDAATNRAARAGSGAVQAPSALGSV